MNKVKFTGSTTTTTTTTMVSLLFLTSPLALSFFFSPSSFFNLFNNPLSSSSSPPNITTILLQIFIIFSTVGFFTMHYLHRKQRQVKDKKIIPQMLITSSGSIDKLERFSHYVGRQLGLEENGEGSQIGRLAEGYLRKSQGHEDNIYEYLNNIDTDETLYIKLIEEFDRCILGYFAFHWSHASVMITQVLSNVESEPKRKLKNMVMAATRKQRFERVTKDLKVTRVFSTLVEEMKAIKSLSNDDTENTNVMVPAAHSQRSPVLLFMGGGMGAGKSTVLKDILKQSFWADAAANAVVVEADAFKETDVIYKALSSRGHHDMLHTAELVHQSSTDAASSLLVTALNEGRDVIMDGTLSWEPFVNQTIDMARNVHHHRYRMGVGYKVDDDGTVTENYWEQVEHERHTKRKPYRIELVGVVCDPYLAVVRGIRRAIFMGRAVRVKSQLISHQRFANTFPRYCQLVDNARLYCTNAMGGPPLLIGWKDGANNILVDPDEISCLKTVSTLNEDADSIHEVYQNEDPLREVGSVWKDIVLSPARAQVQEELKNVIQKAEGLLATDL